MDAKARAEPGSQKFSLGMDGRTPGTWAVIATSKGLQWQKAKVKSESWELNPRTPTKMKAS